jgi:adenosylmethionine-8-amino-7-oxononanoate aminotransferase
MLVSEQGVFTAAFTEHLVSIETLPFPDSPEKASACLPALERALETEPIGRIIVEPLVQGAAGMRGYDTPILDKTTARCRAQGALVIFDEVMTGFGRTGPLFASHSVHNQHHLICLSKGILGGMLPFGATTGG